MYPPDDLHELQRRWLAASLRGERPAWSGELGMPADLVRTAEAEGVVALLSQHAKAHADSWSLPESLLPELASAARNEIVAHLLREAECRRVLECLANSNLPALLLKGSALAYWAYDAPWLRACVDIDFLLATRDKAETAARSLELLGYRPLTRALAGDLVSFETGCVRVVAGTEIWVDLHWGIGGAPLFADRFGADELFAASIALPALAANARALGPVHAYLHNTTHRALQLHAGTGDRLKWHYDLHLLACKFSGQDWEALAQLCEQRALARVCVDAMEHSARLFETALPQAFVARLGRAAAKETIDVRRMRSWRYAEYLNFRALPSLKQRLRWLGQRILPNRAYLEDMYGGRWTGYTRYLRKGLRKFWTSPP